MTEFVPAAELRQAGRDDVVRLLAGQPRPTSRPKLILSWHLDAAERLVGRWSAVAHAAQ
ncbi:MAG: hypothetical protein AB7F35_14400 [Acetobacteraceae bacterium]